MCLERSAHGVAPQHPIFDGPFPLTLSYDEAPTPESYRRYVDGVDLPETLPVVHIDTEDYSTSSLIRGIHRPCRPRRTTPRASALGR